MDELLPTPTEGDSKASGSRNLEGSKAHEGVSLTDALRYGNSHTSRSSPASEDSTLPSKPTDSGASARSRSSQPASESSSDGGRLFPDGEMSTGSQLLPTPSHHQYESQSAEMIEARRARERALGRNGNGFGLTTAMALTVLTSSAEGSPVSQRPQLGDGRGPATSGGSGPSSPVSLASWDPDTSSWRTFQASLLSTEDERFPRSWETWPRSGMTRDGQAFALPTSARVTDANASFSSLRTPHGMSGGTGGKPYDDHGSELAQQIYDLPTPAARDFRSGKASEATMGHNARPLNEVVETAILPTPTARLGDESSRGADPERYKGSKSQGGRRSNLDDAVAAAADGRFLLPTPRSTDSQGSGIHGDGGMDLRTVIRSRGEATPPPSQEPSEPSDEQPPDPSTTRDG